MIRRWWKWWKEEEDDLLVFAAGFLFTMLVLIPFEMFVIWLVWRVQR